MPGAGAVQLTVAEPLPATAVGAAGADGGSPGVAERDTLDASLVPSPLVAVTVTVYAVPLVSPVRVQFVAGGVAVHVAPSGEAVAV